MRFLGIGNDNDLGSLYLRLMQGGHEVKVFIANAESADTLGGLIHRTTDSTPGARPVPGVEPSHAAAR